MPILLSPSADSWVVAWLMSIGIRLPCRVRIRNDEMTFHDDAMTRLRSNYSFVLHFPTHSLHLTRPPPSDRISPSFSSKGKVSQMVTIGCLLWLQPGKTKPVIRSESWRTIEC